MNKYIDFTKLEGLATYQDTLAFLQESYRGAFAGIAASFGNHVIISGVADLGANWGDGWVVIDGELLPFAGGLKAAQVIVEELTDTEVFGDDSIQTVYFTKRAKCASAGGTDMVDFVRLSTFANISTGLANLITTVASLATVPTGVIQMWPNVAAPAGWILCNGSNVSRTTYADLFAVIGTTFGAGDGSTTFTLPDLRGKFIVGYNSADADYNAIGKTGGEKKHTLTQAELPAVKIDVPIPLAQTSTTDGGSGKITMGSSGNEPVDGPTLQTNNLGSGNSHENRPPYSALAYIIKL